MLVCVLGSSPPSIRFISVSNSLPKTSYVKMIDIWLLFNLTIPFAEVNTYYLWTIECNLTKYCWAQVLLQTYIEYLRGLVEDKKTINHHGREVEVDLDLVSEKPSLTQVYDLKWVSKSLASSGTKDWSFSVVLVRHMGSSFQSTKKYSARPWRNFMKGSRLVDVYKKGFALKFVSSKAEEQGAKTERRLRRATLVAHYVSPIVAVTFAVVYWVIGMINVMYPSMQQEMWIDDNIKSSWKESINWLVNKLYQTPSFINLNI